MSEKIKVYIDKLPPKSNKEKAVVKEYLWEPGQTIHVRFLNGVPEVQEKVK
ncbi:hypothetical protein L1M59_11530 [Bacillus sp. ET1]|nr:hypothetical protein [Bacillus sp. ET1]